MEKKITDKEKNPVFAERLRTLRKKSGYSQKEFAEVINLHQVQYGRYERGDSKPYAETLTKIADALGVSTDYLLEGQEEDAIVANLEDKDLLRLFQEIEGFTELEKEHVKFVLESIVKNKKHKQLAG